MQQNNIQRRYNRRLVYDQKNFRRKKNMNISGIDRKEKKTSLP